MAKGTTVGFLNFGIDGDNKELMKKLEQAKKEAVSIQQVMQDIMRSRSQAGNNQLNTQSRRDSLNQARIQEIQTRSLERQRLIQEQVATQVARTERIRQQMLTQSTASQNQLTNAIGLTNRTMFSQRNLLQQMSQALGVYFSIYQVGAFVKELANISGEFEKQRVSLAAILQDQEAANKIFSQVKELAVYSPFNFKELTAYAKQLSAFSIPTNEIFDTMKRLADVSAGLGVDMNRIILAYGQVRSASVLRGQELRQFTEAGIPLVDELAKKFGELEGRVVSAGEVFDKISNRQVPFQMVKDIFQDLTSEGGKFYQMQEVQSATLAGKISNLRDNYDIMLDSIGQANRGMLHGALDGLVDVMDNWEEYWKVLKSIIVTYGTYKAVLIAAAVAQKGVVAIEQISFFINLTRAVYGTSAATTVLSTTLQGLKAAIATNPIGALAAGLSALAGLAIMFSDSVKETSEVISDLSKAADSYAGAIDGTKDQTSKLLETYDELSSRANLNEKEQSKLRDTMESLAKTVPNAATQFDEYGRILNINTEIVKKYSAEQKQYLKEGLENEIEEAEKRKDMLLKQQAIFTDILENGLKGASGGTEGYQEFRQALSNDQLKKYQNDRAEITKNLIELDGEIIKSRNILNGILDTPIANKNELSNWQKELKMILGNTLSIQIDSNIPDVTKELKEKYKDLKTDIDNQKPILIKFGFDFENGKFPFPASPIAMQQAENYIRTQEALGRVNNAAKALNVTLDDKKKKTEKDKFTDDLKKQVELIKSAKTEYEKLLKLMPKEKAGETLTSIKEYSKIDLSNLTDEGYVKYLESMLAKIKNRNTDTAKNIRISWNKELGQIQVEQITDKAKAELDKIEKYLSQYKDKYSLYESIFNITGDKGQAASLAFGDPQKQVDEYMSVLKNAFRQSSGISFEDFVKLDDKTKQQMFLQDDLKKLFDQIQTEAWDSRSDFTKRMADLVKEFQSVDDQITAIRNKGEKNRLDIIKNSDNASQDLVNKRLEANQQSVNKEIADLTNGVLQATESYQKLFGDLGDISNKELQLLIQRWKEALNNAVKDGNGMLKVTIDGKEFTTTEKEVANFTKRVIASEKEMRDRNPFKALKDSLDELKKNRSQIQQIQSEIENLAKVRNAALSDKEAGKGDIGLDNVIESTTSKIKRLTAELETMQGKGATALQKVGIGMSSVGSEVQSVASSLSSFFDSLGNEDLSDTMSFLGEMVGHLTSIGAGLTSGNYIQAATGILGALTSIFNQHDKKLDKAIKKSQIEVQKLQGNYESLSRFISRQLGAVTEKQTKEQIENLKKQQEELIKQREAESKKKKGDQSAIIDYIDSIKELQDQIDYFYEDLLSDEYGLDLKSISDQISSSLVDAFKNGEDAALAFNNTVADIINNLAQKMISLQVIEPAMDKLRDYLFGENGVFSDGELSVSDAQGLVGLMGGLKNSIGDAKTIWDALNEAAKQVGIDLGSTSVKDTLSKGIQSITEDTANLLASYLNAIRADVAATRAIISQLIQIAQTNSNTFALQLAELVKIQVNTLATANNTARLVQLAESTNSILQNGTVRGSGTTFNI